MAESIDQLISSRKALIETLESNSFASGIHRLLTDIYPDTAHFVYELLQNAEDVEATRVRFELDPRGVYFAHNGKKEFTLEDVDAITSIGGNLGKKEDSTSIGEFGVGFKAVFSYTSTPEIHSGGYHFRIHDFFVPDTEGVAQSPLKPGIPSGWTEFFFPFNSPTKEANVAYDETLKGLQRLDESSLLFLAHIARIDYSFGVQDWQKGFVERTNVEEDLVVVSSGSGKTTSSSEYLRYIKQIEITSDRGKTKRLPIGIAYRVDSANGGGILPIDDARTFIYFPAEKERSNLKFHINAPFSATVARDSIRDCDDNRRLMEQVAELVVATLGDIKRRGLISTSFYAVMPNNFDVLGEMYDPIRKAVFSAFEDGEYLVAKGGGFLRASKAMVGSRVLSDAIGEAALEGFVRTDRRWAANPPLKNVNRREEDFLASLPVKRFAEIDFAKAFNDETKRGWLIEYAQGLDVRRTQFLYTALACVVSAYLHGNKSEDEHVRRRHDSILSRFFTNLKKAPIAKCIDGRLRRPSDVYFLPSDLDPSVIQDPLIDPVYVDDSCSRFGYVPANVRQMFERLGVPEYSLSVELSRLLEKYSKKVNARDKSYYRDLITIVRAHNKGIDIDFSQKSLFLAEMPDGGISLCQASAVAIGDAYGVYLGDQMAKFAGTPLLSDLYLKAFAAMPDITEKDCNDFVSFLKWCGASTELTIERCDVKKNPSFERLLVFGKGKRETATAESSDFTIRGLPKSLEDISYEMAFELWRVLCSHGSTPKYAQACYRPNKSAGMATCDSTLITHLKAHPWIPNAFGELCRPGELSFQDIDHSFREIAEGKLVEALDIGAEVSAHRIAERQLESDAAKIGKHLVSDEDYKMLQGLKEKQRKAAERSARSEGASIEELFERQDRIAESHTEKPKFDTGSVSNSERRAQNIAETIRDQQALPVRRQSSFSVVYAANRAEKETLRQWYHGRCQICGTIIPRSDGQRYFEAINILSTTDLPVELRNTLGLAWNSLCLCPNCAAKYRYSAKRISGLPQQIEEAEVIDGSPEEISIEIELAGRTVDISFVPKHIVALREGVRALDAER